MESGPSLLNLEKKSLKNKKKPWLAPVYAAGSGFESLKQIVQILIKIQFRKVE